MTATQASRRRRIAVGLVLLTALAACSSTNKKDGDAAADTGALESSQTPDVGTSTGPDGSVVTTTAGASAGGSASAGTSGTTRPRSTAAGGSSTAPGVGKPSAPTVPRGGYTGRVGPGVTDKEMYIGITLFKIGEFFKGFGSDADPGDTQAQADAAVAYINEHGGIAGRKVVPIYHTFDLTRPGLQEGQSEQEACAKWTQDNKVFAAVNITYSRFAILTCLAKADVVGMHDGLVIDARTLAKHRKYYYSVSQQISIDRQARFSTRVFCARGWFKGAKVGIQYYEDPEYRRVVDQIYIPELAKCGVPKDKVVLQGAPRGGTDAPQYAAKFKAEGVTHVMFLGEASAYPLFFMRAAEDQQYRPAYGLTTAQTPALFLQDVVPPEQLKKAIGAGWLPTADVDLAQDPGPVSEPNKVCYDIMRKAGEDVSNRQVAYQALTYCSSLWFLQQNLAKSTGLNSDALVKVVEGLGAGFTSASTFGTFYGPGKPDGPSLYRDFAFPNGKSEYTSGNKPMP